MCGMHINCDSQIGGGSKIDSVIQVEYDKEKEQQLLSNAPLLIVVDNLVEISLSQEFNDIGSLRKKEKDVSRGKWKQLGHGLDTLSS